MRAFTLTPGPFHPHGAQVDDFIIATTDGISLHHASWPVTPAMHVPVGASLAKTFGTGFGAVSRASVVRSTEGDLLVIAERTDDRRRRHPDALVLVRRTGADWAGPGRTILCPNAGLTHHDEVRSKLLRRTKLVPSARCANCGTGLRAGFHPRLSLPPVGADTDGVLVAGHVDNGDTLVVLRPGSRLDFLVRRLDLPGTVFEEHTVQWDGSNLSVSAAQQLEPEQAELV